MKIAWIATSGRDLQRKWDETEHPGLGTTVVAMMEGFRAFPEHEVHVLMAVRRNCLPDRREGNIIYHEVPTPMWGMMKSLYYGSTRALLRKIREISPDVVHGQGTERECAFPGLYSGLPNIVTIHGNMAELARLNRARPFSFYWLAAKLETFALARTNGVFCNSAYTHGLVASRTKTTWMVPNPLMSEFFVPPRDSGTHASPTVLNVGVVSPRKRQVEILELAKELHPKAPALRWAFIGPSGEDDYSRQFRSMVESPAFQPFVRYHGRMEYSAIREEMDRCHAMVHFPFEESFGLVAAESIARGMKLFTADIGGLSDICSGVPGVELFAVNDWKGLGDGIFRWCRDGASRVESGPAMMAERYHPQVVAREHLRIYGEILASRRGH